MNLHLLVQVHCQEEYMSLCRFIRHHLVHTTNSDKMQEIHQQKVPPLPYIFQTPKGLLVDLRLFSRYNIILFILFYFSLVILLAGELQYQFRAVSKLFQSSLKAISEQTLLKSSR